MINIYYDTFVRQTGSFIMPSTFEMDTPSTAVLNPELQRRLLYHDFRSESHLTVLPIENYLSNCYIAKRMDK